MEDRELLSGKELVKKRLQDIALAIKQMSQEEFNELLEKAAPTEPPHPMTGALERWVCDSSCKENKTI